MNWDDTRFFLALAREGSLSGAARVLQISHSTVGRRIEALEEKMGIKLFVKTPEGYLLSNKGATVLGLAEELEVSALAFERRVTGLSDELSGELVVTTVDVMVPLLGEVFKTFCTKYPAVEVTIRVDNRVSNLTRRESDVAIRLSNTPPEHLVGRRIGTLKYCVYGTDEIAQKLKEGHTTLAELPWVMWDKRFNAAKTERWYQSMRPSKPPIRVDSGNSMISMVKHGIAVGAIAKRMGEYYGLTQIGEEIEGFDFDIWVLTHPDLRHARRVVAFMNTLREHF